MRVTRTRVLEVGEIGPALRAQLQPELIELFLMSFEFSDPEMFARRVLFRCPDAKLTLLYGVDDEIVGFNVYNIDLIDVGGQRHGVVHGSAYGHPELRGGGEFAFRRLLIETLRFKLRHPRVPLCLVGEASTPAGYARVARHFPLHHPRRGVELPTSITKLVQEVMRQRGFSHVDADPWRVGVELPIAFSNPERTRRHAETSEDPSIAFYLERNPDFLRGHWLVVYIPLDLLQLRAAIRRSLTSSLFSALVPRRAPRRQ